ncbi:NnrS family protein [Pseudomonas sp. UBA6310]|uniref:NnrS family protein n=1 Tax=Pseudomonas sp. UBA6310 TaxID=1947327 RepID=UPI00257A75DE|nr:NnrS family protein [Pseudomonas sp. UBA6310]
MLQISRPALGFPLWRLGFRPFFLGCAAYACVALGLWLLALSGVPVWQPTGGWLAWHLHEMPFGFGVAAVAGFLLTAVPNWTGAQALSGPPLATLFLLWLLTRLAWLGGASLALCAVLELAFLPLLAFALGRSLWRARQRNNYPLVGVLLLFALADGLAVAGQLLDRADWQRQGAHAALWLLAALSGIIGGRVIPFFTQRGLGRTQAVPALKWLERPALAGLAVLAVLAAAGLDLQPRAWMALPFGLVGVLHGIRLSRWYDKGLWRVPLLWSLHLAYAWLVLALLGMAAWHLGLIDNGSAALHALTVGGLAGLILAMMARVSLGHSGRPLLPPAGMRWAFVALNAAAFARVLLPTWLPQGALVLAGLLWLLAFGMFLARYAGWLCQPRVDGLSG